MDLVSEHKRLCDALVRGFVRTAAQRDKLYMVIDEGITSIVFEYYLVDFDGSKLWLGGKWEIKKEDGYCDGITCDSTLIITIPKVGPRPFGQNDGGTVKFNDDDTQNIDMWFNSHSFLVCKHRGYKEVMYTLSHHGPLYETHIDEDNNYRGNIRWKQSDKSELIPNWRDKFPKKMTPSNHFSGTWKCNDEIIRIEPPAERTMYDGLVTYHDGSKYKIGYWFNNFVFAYYPDKGTAVIFKSEDGKLYQKGRTENNTVINRVWNPE